MSWLAEYCKAAEGTDQLIGQQNHVLLLAVGIFGEAGSILAELKKRERETDAYPASRSRLVEEFGDCLWYLSRLSAVLDPCIVQSFDARTHANPSKQHKPLTDAIAFGVTAGELLSALQNGDGKGAKERLEPAWDALFSVVRGASIDPREAAEMNLQKIRSRWPEKRDFSPFFDEDDPEEEQLPRKLDLEFRRVQRGKTDSVIVRCNGLNFGDSLTDNIEEPDFYRFHDVFHFAYAVYLGWSPVIRALLKCKRKSKPEVDVNQDGARARIIEEAVSAIVFSRAKEMNFYAGIDHIDYDLLKAIQEFIRGFEVANIPLWQWETAILEGYRVFRALRMDGGGLVTLNMNQRQLLYRKVT